MLGGKKNSQRKIKAKELVMPRRSIVLTTTPCQRLVQFCQDLDPPLPSKKQEEDLDPPSRIVSKY